MIATPPSLVLFDLDGVLVSYSHRIRCETLGAAIGRTHAAVIGRPLPLNGAGVWDRVIPPRRP